MKTFYYFEACGLVSEPFHAADLAAAEVHVLSRFRNPAGPDFDNDDGGILGLDDDPVDPWWECQAIFIGNTGHNPDNAARLGTAIGRLTGPTAPTPGGP